MRQWRPPWPETWGQVYGVILSMLLAFLAVAYALGSILLLIGGRRERGSEGLT